MKKGLVCILVLSCLIINIIGFSYIYKHENKNVDNTIQLYDVCHNLFGEIDPYYHNLTDMWINFLLLVIIIKKETRNDILNFVIVCALSYIIRPIIFSSTLMPSSVKNCKTKNRRSCNDMMYSGHITLTLLSLLFLWKHNIIDTYVVILGTLIPSYIILATKNHYTSDIIVSIIINTLLFFQVFKINLH